MILDAAKRRWFLETVCTIDWNVEQDRGRTWKVAEDLLVKEFPEEESLIRSFRSHWHEMVADEVDGSVAIFETLIEKGYDITLLTNFSQETFPEAQEKFPFLKLGRGVTVSGDVKLIKPDEAIYKAHQDAFDLDPARTIFIDDSLPNVIAARAFGGKSEQFIDAAAWKADLARHGVEV